MNLWKPISFLHIASIGAIKLVSFSRVIAFLIGYGVNSGLLNQQDGHSVTGFKKMQQERSACWLDLRPEILKAAVSSDKVISRQRQND